MTIPPIGPLSREEIDAVTLAASAPAVTTLRDLADEYDLTLEELFAALELRRDVASHNPDAPLRPRVEAVWRIVLESRPA